MARAITFSEGEYYHVFNRGVERRTIFQDERDKNRFQRLLYLCNSKDLLQYSVLNEDFPSASAFYQIDRGKELVHIGSYCLLKNHFHLLIKEFRKGGLSLFMQKLSTAYTMYFNIRNERTGALFEGRFRARHVDHDEYLKYLFSYIHLNPAEHIESEWRERGAKNTKKIWDYVSNYHFSSLYDYGDSSRPEYAILSKSEFPEYFDGDAKMKEEIHSWLELKPETLKDKEL